MRAATNEPVWAVWAKDGLICEMLEGVLGKIYC